MEDIIVLIVLAVVLIAAIVYVVKAKKKGIKCIGCPHANVCSQNAENSSCSCNGNTEN